MEEVVTKMVRRKVQIEDNPKDCELDPAGASRRILPFYSA